MSFDLFQVLCLGILVLAYGFTLRVSKDARRSAVEITLLVIAAWAGEQSCISRYHFYAYAEGWWFRLGDVPAIVPLIWPMVILSARQVVRELWPQLSGTRRAIVVALAVVVDASLMEVIAVASGLWTWAEPGYYAVPLIGILGWGFFGFGAAWWLDRCDDVWRGRPKLLWLLPVVSVAATHILLVLAWWGGLRWGLRSDLGTPALVVFCVAMTLAVWPVMISRRAGRSMTWSTTIPRIIASSIFFVLLALLPQGSLLPLLAHTVAVAIPYLASVRWSRSEPDIIGQPSL